VEGFFLLLSTKGMHVLNTTQMTVKCFAGKEEAGNAIQSILQVNINMLMQWTWH